ncbi:MAG TPA: protoporphyrinogen oxidase [Gemmatimonadaceae bacterium]|nr:protoporphyrinogen oxidase [Gemmatimonadaceae bacterium]
MSTPHANAHVVIVGGGISGLAAAHRLTESARPPRITLLEASPRFGGWIDTDRLDGWVLERGPDLFLGGKPGAYELCERLGIAERLHGTAPTARSSYILRGGRMFRLPEGLTGLVPTRMGPFARSPLLSPLAKLRVAMEPFVTVRRDAEDESVESFVVRRLGREMYARLVEPLLSGIYAGDGAALSLLATFPQFRESERVHGGMLRAMLAARKRKAPPMRGFLTFPTGLAELPEALVARLRERGATLRADAPVRALDRGPGGWTVRLADGDSVDATAVIVATSAHAAAALLAPHAAAAAAALRGIPHATTATVSLGYRASDVPLPLDASGYLIPRAEGREALAVTWTSSKFDGRAPAGQALLRIFLGGAARPPIDAMDDGGAVRVAREEVAATMGIRAEPTLTRVAWQRGAMPQYVTGHRARVAQVREGVAALPGLAIAGNALEGVGIPDCVRSGEAAAARVVEGLASFPTS